jgi:hypothetical protein
MESSSQLRSRLTGTARVSMRGLATRSAKGRSETATHQLLKESNRWTAFALEAAASLWREPRYSRASTMFALDAPSERFALSRGDFIG